MNISKSSLRMFILAFVLGILFSMQVKILSKGIKYVPLENIKEITLEIKKEKAEVEQLKKALKTSNETIELYANASDVDYSELISDLKKKRDQLEIFLNYTDVEGTGVIVIIDDADRELLEYEDPNYLLVHDSQIAAIIDDLRNAGAEAISVNGERIVFNNSEIICVGPTVKINGEQMAPPYIIRAIGNRKYLEAAINAPDTTSEYLRLWGIFVEVNTSISVEIDKYEYPIINNYLKVYEEGGN